MKTGFGFVQAKGATAFAPIAMTPDELGNNFRDFKVQLDMVIHRDGKKFGSPDGGEMHFGFDQLISHAALTRKLNPGTVIGSGTVSNEDPMVSTTKLPENGADHLNILSLTSAGRTPSI